MDTAIRTNGMKERLQEKKTEAMAAMTWALASAGMAPVHAINFDPVTVNENIDAANLVGMIIGLVVQIATWMGALTIVVGLIMFGYSLMNDNPEGKTRAGNVILAGAVLLIIRTLLATLNVAG